jgi:hypothetical protein
MVLYCCMHLFSSLRRPHFLPILIVLFFGILASRTLIFQSGYFNMHDDLQMMRQLEMEKCFHDGQIPCRWVPDMGYGFGFPLFNFYPPLPYLVGEVFRAIGFSFMDTAKLTFATALILSGIFMYLFAKEFFGRIGGVLSAIFYLWAPYHAVDIYVRGAMNESWALVFFPLICWAAFRLIANQESGIKNQAGNFKWIILLALSYFGLFTSHNLMLMIFTPVFGIYVLIILWQKNAWKKIPSLLLGGLWALGLSAFFTFPALLENKFTQIAGQLVGYYDYSGHFVTIRQLLFSTFWGYGPSTWLEEDGMSFQIGYVHWILSLVVGLLLIVRIVLLVGQELRIKNKQSLDFQSQELRWGSSLFQQLKKDPFILTSLFFLLVGWFSGFMTHSRSTPLWGNIKQIAYLQFPWRFLTLIIFTFSFMIGAIPGIIADFKSHHGWFAKLSLTIPQILIASLLSLIAITYSWTYFLPQTGHMGNLTDSEKFSGKAWDLQQTAGIYDYLPATAKTAPKAPQTSIAEVMEGDASLSGLDQGTYWGLFSAKVEDENAVVRIGMFDFPGMQVQIDGKQVDHYIPDTEEWGRMYVDVPQGEHKVYVQLLNTPVRTVSNIISFVCWGILIGLVVLKKPFKTEVN